MASYTVWACVFFAGKFANKVCTYLAPFQCVSSLFGSTRVLQKYLCLHCTAWIVLLGCVNTFVFSSIVKFTLPLPIYNMEFVLADYTNGRSIQS